MIAVQTTPSSIAPRNVLGSWIGANALGLGLGMAVFAGVAEGIEQSGILGSPAVGERFGHLFGLALAGVIFGLMQWWALRRYIALSRWMILGTVVGLMLGYIVGYELGGPPVDFVLAPGLAGLFGGFQQWQALRASKRAGGWPWISMVGLMLGGAAGTAVAMMGLGDTLGGSLWAWISLNGVVFAIAGAVGGAISGMQLRWLVRHIDS